MTSKNTDQTPPSIQTFWKPKHFQARSITLQDLITECTKPDSNPTFEGTVATIGMLTISRSVGGDEIAHYAVFTEKLGLTVADRLPMTYACQLAYNVAEEQYYQKNNTGPNHDDK